MLTNGASLPPLAQPSPVPIMTSSSIATITSNGDGLSILKPANHTNNAGYHDRSLTAPSTSKVSTRPLIYKPNGECDDVRTDSFVTNDSILLTASNLVSHRKHNSTRGSTPSSITSPAPPISSLLKRKISVPSLPRSKKQKAQNRRALPPGMSDVEDEADDSAPYHGDKEGQGVTIDDTDTGNTSMEFLHLSIKKSGTPREYNLAEEAPKRVLRVSKNIFRVIMAFLNAYPDASTMSEWAKFAWFEANKECYPDELPYEFTDWIRKQVSCIWVVELVC